MPTLTPNQVETIYRDESYEAFLTELPRQSEELESQGFFQCFGDTVKTDAYSTFKTHVFGSYDGEAGRNPGEALNPGTMGQGYNYWTAIRSEFNEVRSIAAEYLESTLKLGDYAAVQGGLQAKNYFQSNAEYWTFLLSLGGIVPATLAATGNGSAGRRPRSRIFAHYLKGMQGAIIPEIPVGDQADPDGKAWFAFAGNEHIRANGDTSASFAGKTLGYFNAGNRAGTNMPLTESNLENVLLHMENDIPFGPDRIFYSAKLPDTLIVSGNLRSIAEQIVNLNEYRLNTPNNDKNVMYTQSKVFGIRSIVVNRFLPDNCWYLCAKGTGVNKVMKNGRPGPVGVDGPVDGTVSNIYVDQPTQTYVRQFFGYWSHQFNSDMDICWYAGSTPTAIASGRPTAPTVASLANW